ncbi:MAG: CPBP family intramembrane metalloprotease [Capnocytophaga sp.]|nr:CPBP family intramembrane metalloprotease [Capnocytophaga sp.]
MSLKINHLVYFIPLLLYVIIFSGGFKSFANFNFSSTPFSTIAIYTFKYFTLSFFEEFLFRGLILGLFLSALPKTKEGVFLSVLLSSLFFGVVHIVNLWSIENQTLKGVLNQIYAATCLGVMYGAIYVRTKNLILLGVFHFLTNFFASIGELNFIQQPEIQVLSTDETLLEIVINEILRLVIFGIPLFIGSFLILKTDSQ